MRRLLVVLAFGLAGAAPAADGVHGLIHGATTIRGATPAASGMLERIKVAAQERIERRKFDAEAAALRKKLLAQIDQRCVDTGRTWDSCATDVVKDWLVDRREGLEAMDPKLLDQAAAFFMLVYERKVSPPPDVREEMERHESDIINMLERE
jgi:hypothetical protein